MYRKSFGIFCILVTGADFERLLDGGGDSVFASRGMLVFLMVSAFICGLGFLFSTPRPTDGKAQQ